MRCGIELLICMQHSDPLLAAYQLITQLLSVKQFVSTVMHSASQMPIVDVTHTGDIIEKWSIKQLDVVSGGQFFYK